MCIFGTQESSGELQLVVASCILLVGKKRISIFFLILGKFVIVIIASNSLCILCKQLDENLKFRKLLFSELLF